LAAGFLCWLWPVHTGKGKVVISSPKIKKPKYVRFAWDESAMPNFFNKEGLPAVPFRTGK